MVDKPADKLKRKGCILPPPRAAATLVSSPPPSQSPSSLPSAPSFPPAGPLPRRPPPPPASSCSSAQPRRGCRRPPLPSTAAPRGGRHCDCRGGGERRCRTRPASTLAFVAPSLPSPNSTRVVQGLLLPNSASPPPPPTRSRAPASPLLSRSLTCCSSPSPSQPRPPPSDSAATPIPSAAKPGRLREPQVLRPVVCVKISGWPIAWMWMPFVGSADGALQNSFHVGRQVPSLPIVQSDR
ncbi:hypothetical protein SETIT_1G274200v2 [Setaria italica]|uniref:Uncharacterized protein n=1 Tax=Setaria italica TaxID=4555 RepID=A0A368PPW7_SETIT|nr:hypothetical protein SETIT_1G274200v2 [Setaria italica]